MAAQNAVATLVRSIFAQPGHDGVHAQHAQVVEQLETGFPEEPLDQNWWLGRLARRVRFIPTFAHR